MSEANYELFGRFGINKTEVDSMEGLYLLHNATRFLEHIEQFRNSRPQVRWEDYISHPKELSKGFGWLLDVRREDAVACVDMHNYNPKTKKLEKDGLAYYQIYQGKSPNGYSLPDKRGTCNSWEEAVEYVKNYWAANSDKILENEDKD